MDCPSCNHPDAYIGLLWIHCRNTDCCFFDEKYDAKLKRERSTRFKDAVDRLIELADDQGTIHLDDLD